MTKELEILARAIDRNIPCVPSTYPPSSDELKQLAAWRKLIAWERSNPLKTEDTVVVARRVIFAYEQCLLCLGYQADLW